MQVWEAACWLLGLWRLRSRRVRLQRRMSRKIKFSANWYKAKEKAARLHQKIANTRKDALHKASTTISKNHAVVAMERLRVGKMTASAAGTLDTPGKNVRSKSGLNRRILDQGWGAFRGQIEYKLNWTGGRVVLVNPRNTSLTCAVCQSVDFESRKSQAVFMCVACGFEANADTNAARNILRAGQAQIACGDSPMGVSMKQEAQPASLAAVEKSLAEC